MNTRAFPIIVILLLSILVLAASFANAATPRPFDYIVVIVLENHGLKQIYGKAPYMTQLANSYGLATDYSAVQHPSMPNYVALLAGSTFGCSNDVNPNSDTCTKSFWNSQNLVDRIEAAGLTWKAYMEDMPSNCYGSNGGGGTNQYPNYAVRHDPFVYFSDIVNNPARCARVIPDSPGATSLTSDLGSTSTASNFMWLTPNLCNDMHVCSTTTNSADRVAVGDNYLSQLVPQILNSYIFKTQKAALFITFDEGIAIYPLDIIYSVWAGPVAKNNYKSSKFYSHYSFLKTLETAWGLSPLTSNDNGASDMMEFLKGSSSITTTTSSTTSSSTGSVTTTSTTSSTTPISTTTTTSSSLSSTTSSTTSTSSSTTRSSTTLTSTSSQGTTSSTSQSLTTPTSSTSSHVSTVPSTTTPTVTSTLVTGSNPSTYTTTESSTSTLTQTGTTQTLISFTTVTSTSVSTSTTTSTVSPFLSATSTQFSATTTLTSTGILTETSYSLSTLTISGDTTTSASTASTITSFTTASATTTTTDVTVTTHNPVTGIIAPSFALNGFRDDALGFVAVLFILAWMVLRRTF